MRFISPPSVNGDLGSAPVFFTTADIGREDPETWIDRNEDTVLPTGVTADALVNEYAVFDSKIYSAAVAKAGRDVALLRQYDGPPPYTMNVPLWNLARLYGEQIATPFIICKISAEGSVLGLVQGGMLQRLVNCHIDCDDCTANAAEAISVIKPLCDSLAGNTRPLPVLLFSPESTFTMPVVTSEGGFAFQTAPAIKGVSAWCHEAYANARSGSPDMNFVAFDSVRKVHKLNERFNRLRTAVRIAVIGCAAVLALFAVADGVIRFINGKYHDQMERFRSQSEIVFAAEKREEMLLHFYRAKVRFAEGRSHCTALLSNFQTVFPEGAWAKTISMTSNQGAALQCEIDATAYSNGLVSEAVENMRKIAGASNVRIAYSEQIVLPDGRKAVSFKIKCEWRYE